MQSLYAKPTLPQSALLNSLPLDSALIGQLQNFLESFTQLLNPTPNQVRQIRSNFYIPIPIWIKPPPYIPTYCTCVLNPPPLYDI
jgi:hypothetical protein